MTQTAPNTLPKLSVAERDRRYGLIRAHLKERGVDCVIVEGPNLTYLSNGLPGDRFGLLTAADLPFYAFLNRRHLADLPAQFLEDAQEWVKDIRPSTGANAFIDLISELHLEKGKIGYTNGSGHADEGAMSYAVYDQLQKGLPSAELVDVSSIFNDVRTIKSDEEVEMIAHANRAWDAAIDAVHHSIRPGMLGADLVKVGIRAMWDAGADVNSDFFISFGKVAKQNPVRGALCLDLPVQAGDIATMTAHAYYGNYGGHSDAEITVGPPSQLHTDMFNASLHAREAVLKAVKPGATQRDLTEAYEKAGRETGFETSPHSQIHQYGIEVPEFPGPAFRADNTSVLAPGMIYSVSPTIVSGPEEETVLGGNSLVVTEDGYRELTDRKVKLLVADV